jgi:glycosyltransferase involved in cell wall biosynthesis
VTVAYLRDARDGSFGVTDKASGLGIDYAEVVERHSADVSVLVALRRLVRDRSIDIIHSHDYKTDLFALVLAWLEGVIPLSTTHGFSGHSWRERWVYYPLDRQLLRAFPCVIAVSSDIGELLAAAGVARERIRVILNGIDHQVFTRNESLRPQARARLGLRPDEFAIGAIGRIEREKRYDILIDAFLRVESRHPRARLLIAGDGSLRASLQTNAMRSTGSDRIRFLGHYPDVIGLHHALDLFVQSSSNEGTPNAVLEAMALETPVVATAVGGTPELIRDTVDGLLVPSDDISALASAVEQCLEAPEPLRTRALSARSRVEGELSFDARQARLEEVYEGLVQSRAPRGRSNR